MGITQNGVVWIKNIGVAISLCSEFRYIAKILGIAKIQIFAMHSNFRYDSENCRYSENLDFTMHSNFSLYSENLAIAKFR